MASERISCLVVAMRDGWGIVTDRDLRTRVVAARAEPETPLEAIATFPARTIASDTVAGEALLAMFAQGVHHFPIVDRSGELIGVVTDTDLMELGQHTPFATKSQIERASTPDEIARAADDLPNLVVTMVRARADPIDVSRVVALVVDAMTQRLIALAIEDLAMRRARGRCWRSAAPHGTNRPCTPTRITRSCTRVHRATSTRTSRALPNG